MTTAVRPSTQDMVIVHRLFRREYRLAPQMVRAVPAGDTARAAVIGAHLTELNEMLHHHHTGEDELVWPKLHERASLQDALITRMEREHEAVEALLTQSGEELARWTATADAAAGEQLAGERHGQHGTSLPERLRTAPAPPSVRGRTQGEGTA